MSEPCYAPVFEGASVFTCIYRQISYYLKLISLYIAYILSFGSESILCRIRQLQFRIDHCRKGNSDPEYDLNLDDYERHVRSYREQYGKNAEWEQWMLENRDRYESTFNRARIKPATLMISFRYQNAPIAYDPPWASESEHMTALKNYVELCYPSYNIEFIFYGDMNISYANVIAGIPTNDSHTSGMNMYVYYETIVNHEFAHVMDLPHHYDTLDEMGTGKHMPPGETNCKMDHNFRQFCSACRTALHIPLDVDNNEAILAAWHVINDRYPY